MKDLPLARIAFARPSDLEPRVGFATTVVAVARRLELSKVEKCTASMMLRFDGVPWNTSPRSFEASMMYTPQQRLCRIRYPSVSGLLFMVFSRSILILRAQPVWGSDLGSVAEMSLPGLLPSYLGMLVYKMVLHLHTCTDSLTSVSIWSLGELSRRLNRRMVIWAVYFLIELTIIFRLVLSASMTYWSGHVLRQAGLEGWCDS